MSGLAKIFIEKKFNFLLLILFLIITLFYLFEVIAPFFIAFIIAYLTNPFKIFLDQYINKTLSSFLAIS